jgi:hypothetical protein
VVASQGFAVFAHLYQPLPLPERLQAAASLLGSNLSVPELSRVVKGKDFETMGRDSGQSYHVSYSAKNASTSIGTYTFDPDSSPVNGLPANQLEDAARRVASKLAVWFGLAAISDANYIPQAVAPESVPEAAYLWFRKVNGLAGGFDGDMIRVLVRASDGVALGFSVQQNRFYEPLKIKVSLEQAVKIAKRELSYRDTKDSIRGDLQYHLFDDKKTKETWKKFSEIHLRAGYYFSCESGSGYVDAETGYAHYNGYRS